MKKYIFTLLLGFFTLVGFAMAKSEPDVGKSKIELSKETDVSLTSTEVLFQGWNISDSPSVASDSYCGLFQAIETKRKRTLTPKEIHVDPGWYKSTTIRFNFETQNGQIPKVLRRPPIWLKV